jgi:hypothetical protein
MIFRESRTFDFRKAIMRKQEHTVSQPIMLKQTSSSNPAAGHNGQGARTTERMAAIRNIKTMAGSPDADLVLRSASRNLAHGLCVSGVRSFVNP